MTPCVVANFAIAVAVPLNLFAYFLDGFELWLMAAFLFCSPYSYHYLNYCNIIVEREITIQSNQEKQKQTTYAKKEASKIKSDTFTRSNRKGTYIIKE